MLIKYLVFKIVFLLSFYSFFHIFEIYSILFLAQYLGNYHIFFCLKNKCTFHIHIEKILGTFANGLCFLLLQFNKFEQKSFWFNLFLTTGQVLNFCLNSFKT